MHLRLSDIGSQGDLGEAEPGRLERRLRQPVSSDSFWPEPVGTRPLGGDDHPGAFRLALLSELSRAAILSYIESPRSSIIGKVSSPRRPSTGTVTDAVNRLVPVGTDMRTYLGRLPWFSAESALARCAGWSAAHQRGPTASAGGP